MPQTCPATVCVAVWADVWNCHTLPLLLQIMALQVLDPAVGSNEGA